MNDSICIGMQVTLSCFWEKLHEEKKRISAWVLVITFVQKD